MGTAAVRGSFKPNALFRCEASLKPQANAHKCNMQIREPLRARTR